MLGLALLVGIILSYRQAPREGVDPQITLDFTLVLVVAGIIGSRAVYVLLNWGMYAGRPLLTIVGLEGGGLSGLAIHGGLLGGLIGGAIMVRRHGLRFWTMADVYARPMAMGHTIGRVGCFLNGCDFGRLTAGPLGARTSYALGLRHPSQLYESGLALLLFLALTWYMRRPRSPGQLFLIYAAGYAVARFVADLFRETEFVAGPLNLAQVISLVVLPIAVALWWRFQRRRADASGSQLMR